MVSGEIGWDKECKVRDKLKGMRNPWRVNSRVECGIFFDRTEQGS